LLKNKLALLRILAASLVGLFLLAYLLLLVPAIQNKLANTLAQRFSKAIGTEVKLGQVRFSLFDKLDLQEILIKDQNKDTLVYTASLKLRLADLVFSSTTPIIKYIGLSDTKIHFKRNNNQWNYAFLLAYLTTDSAQTKNSKGFDIEKIDVTNIQIKQEDHWLGQDMVFNAKNILTNIKSFTKDSLLIDQLILNKPDYLIQYYPGKAPLTKEITKKRNTDKLYFNPNNIYLWANEVQVSRGKFWIEQGFNQPLNYFDGEHIRMHELNANLKNISFNKDTIKAKVNLSVKEQSGFEIKKLITNFRLTPEIMEFSALHLKTNHSTIENYYAMQYRDFGEDFNNYIQNVTMKAHLVNAAVATDDIAYFTPTMASFHNKITTSFHFNGTVANFETNDFKARYNNSMVACRFSMKGIPDMRNTLVSFSHVTANTNYQDLANWIPNLKQVKSIELEKLKNLDFKGDFNGSFFDFITKGQIQSQQGSIVAELRLKFPAKAEPSYDGVITTQHLNIGNIFNLPNLGFLSFKGKIAGSSFDIENIKTKIEGHIDTIEFNKYSYSNISINGLLQKRSFNGRLNIKDPNISFISNIELLFNKDKPKINAVGDLLFANLEKLNITKNKTQLTGLLDINFEGNNIDNFIGFAKFYNGKLKSPTTAVNFDSLTIQSSIVNGLKKLSIASDDIQANIIGKFNILNLPASVQYFMQRYLPTYILAPKNTVSNQLFQFQIKTSYFEPYIRLFDKSFSGFNNISLTGAINTEKQTIEAKGKLPYISWNNYTIKGGDIIGNGTQDSLHLFLTADAFQLSDTTSYTKSALSIHSSKDISELRITGISKSVLEQVDLNATIQTYADGIAMKWKPSFFILNQKKWSINESGSLVLRKSVTSADNLKFTQGLQEFIFSNSPTEENVLQLELKNIILGDITKPFFDYPKLEGLTNGKIQLKNIIPDFTFAAALKIDQFRFNNDSIGFTQLNAEYQNSKGIIPFSFNCPNSEYNLNAKGTYSIKDSINPLDATLFLHHSKFSLVQQFIGGVLTNLEGKANGQIHFAGRIEHPYLLGEASLENSSFVVDYTKVKYFIDSSVIKFTNEGLDFGYVNLRDAQHRPASFKGKILHQGFTHLVYDMEMSSPKIEILHTDPIDNSNFYGHAVGKAAMTIKGPEENIKMVINADVNDSSHIYLPNSTSKESGKSDFIVFKKFGKSAIKSADIPTFNLVVDLEVTANNKTQIDVIMDELTGDVIKAVGNGRIKIRAGNIEPLSIRGKYNIEAGKYDFNFQSFIKKPFELIAEAGNYIEWTGNPYQADIHVDARYTAERVSLNELVGTANFSNAVRTYRGNVYVIAALRNKLAQPDIKFSLAFPQGNPISSDNEFSQFITRLERDDNEILKQVSFLIVFNSFAPVGFSNANANNNNAYTVTSIGINTISHLLTKEVNKSITTILNKVTGDKSLRFDVGSSVYNSANLLDPSGAGIAINANKIDRQRVNLKLGRSFLNEKIIVNVGGDLDFNVQNSSAIQNGSFQWLPDLNVEFILTDDRKLRAIIFNKNSLDISGSSLGRRNRQGLSISYRKDFD
jgi:hypothetical protein